MTDFIAQNAYLQRWGCGGRGRGEGIMEIQCINKSLVKFFKN